MFEKILNLSDDLVLLLNDDFSISWSNLAFCEFQKDYEIEKLSDFIAIDNLHYDFKSKDDVYEFEHFFGGAKFKIKLSRTFKNDKFDTFMLICKKIVCEEIIYDLTYIDPITQGGNRQLNIKRIDDFFEQRVKNPNLKMILFGIDFKHFNRIDYFYGYDVGDKVLRYIVKSLESLSPNAMIGRVSGSTIVAKYIYEDDGDVEVYTKKVTDIFKQPVIIDENTSVNLLAYIGVVILPQDGKDKHEALKNLSIANREAKKHYEQVSLVFFDNKFNLEIDENLHIEKRLNEAIKNEQFELYYQPKIDLESKKIYGFEALLRWNDPEFGNISPMKFIPVSEYTGQIIQIGAWVLRQVCLQSKIWKKQGYNFKTSLNVSIRQLEDPNFINIVKNTINETKADTSLIELEVTESVLCENLEEIIVLLNKIKKLGFTISLDDFGTGYSSLSYLRKIPIDFLKVDRAFMQNICTHTQDAAIAKAIITLAKELSLKVVAEGAEEKGQIQFLENLYCDYVQGFYYYEPMNLNSVNELLKTSPEKLLANTLF